MSEFEYFVVIPHRRYPVFPSEHIYDYSKSDSLGEIRFTDFPTEKERYEIAKKFDAEYITVEKRYEYDKLPFEE